tara:strand:+ start:3831 stop:4136 length:306 start_codon:yes stop_codon:yes gene_type:complete
MSTLTKTEWTSESLEGIKHPWQPEWIHTKEDVNIFLELMDEYRYLAEDERDWYPPYIVYIEHIDGKQMLATMNSVWFLEYDPYRAGRENPLDTLRKNGVNV